MDTFIRDLFFGIRMLLKSPGFALVSVLSLSVGIAVNSTVFSFVNAFMFKTLAVSNADGLVYVYEGNQSNPFRSTSYAKYLEYRSQNEVFSGLAAYAAPPMLMTTGQHTTEINSEVVSANYFSVLDVRMQRGQPFTPEADQVSLANPSVVISDAFWKRRLNADPDVVGKPLTLNGNSFTVVGITAPGFKGSDAAMATDLWVPITQWASIVQPTKTGADNSEATDAKPEKSDHERLGSGHSWLAMFGRLKPGVSLEQAQVTMTTIAKRLQDNNAKKGEEPVVTLASVRDLNPAVREVVPVGIAIIVATSLILLICCVNVTSLMLSRAAARQKEFAVRIALGVSRGRFISQLLTEAMLLSLMGGVLGVFLTYWTTRIVLGVLPDDLGLSAGIAIDRRVLLFSFVIAMLTSLVFGLLPAWNSFRPDLARSLGSDTAFIGGKGKINLRRSFVVFQIVASLVLLIANGIFLRTFQTSQAISQTIGSDKILLLNLSPNKYGYSAKYNNSFYRDLLQRVKAMPGVESATFSNVTPLSLERSSVYISVEGKASSPVLRSVVAEDYFKTLNINIMRGREFDRIDDDESRTVVINEAMAQTFWPNENPLGKTLNMGSKSFEVIGVARDNPYNNLGRSHEPYLYAWLYQRPDENVSLIVRTTGEPGTMIGPVQLAVNELGGKLPVFDFKTLDEVAKAQVVPMKAGAGLLGILSLIGLVVAAIGIYGVTTYAFNQRRKEIGIRMSLGAQRSDILKLIMREGVSLAVVGIAIGTLLGLAITQLVSHFLFGIEALEAQVFIAVALILALVALGSSLAPAIAAARSNPVDVLRYE